jgi:circadian clock protein KaiB
MKPVKKRNGFESLAGDSSDEQQYVLRLYITGATARSARAILNIKNLCEEFLKGRYTLDVIDVFQNPGLAKGEQILAAPTLIKCLPLPLRRFIGDLSRTDKLLAGLDLDDGRSEQVPSDEDQSDSAKPGDRF